jgi:uncharacterized protein YggE
MRKSLFIAAMLLAATPVQAKNDDVFVRQISVSGNCYKEMIPDRGGINLVADITNTKDLKAAVDSATKIYESVKAKVNALKLKDLELTTSEYSVMPINEWENNKQIFKGYRARIGLMVQTSETGRLGEVTAIGAAEGVRDVGALQLFVSRAASKQAMQDCLSDAAIDARKNAERIAAALNVKLGDGLVQEVLSCVAACAVADDDAAVCTGTNGLHYSVHAGLRAAASRRTWIRRSVVAHKILGQGSADVFCISPVIVHVCCSCAAMVARTAMYEHDVFTCRYARKSERYKCYSNSLFH